MMMESRHSTDKRTVKTASVYYRLAKVLGFVAGLH